LRKGIKTKASIVLLAWLVTFAHGVIPHNHMQEGHEGCTGIIHNISEKSDTCDDLAVFAEKPVDLKICHISGLLFKQFDTDCSLISTIKDTRLIPVFISEFRPVANSECFFSEPYFGSSSLRAPPAA